MNLSGHLDVPPSCHFFEVPLELPKDSHKMLLYQDLHSMGQRQMEDWQFDQLYHYCYQRHLRSLMHYHNPLYLEK